MNKKALIGGVLAGMLALGATAVAIAGSSNYRFLVRGNVTAVDRSAKTVTVYTTHASPLATDDLAGNVVEFNATSAKVYRWVNGKKTRVTLGGVPVGYEVVMEGAKNKNGHFEVTKITVNDNAFSVVGLLRDIDTANKTMKVEVSYSSYKSSTFLKKNVIFHYGGNTKFYTRSGSEKNQDEISAGDQRVKITGTVTNGTKWEALKVYDDYAKAK